MIKQDSAGAGGSRRGGRLRGTLVGVQVALCMALMIAAGLLLRGLQATYTVDVGFEYRDVAYVSLESWLDGRNSEEAGGVAAALDRRGRGAARRGSGRLHGSGAIGRRHRVRPGPLPGRERERRQVGPSSKPSRRTISRCSGFRSCADALSRTAEIANRGGRPRSRHRQRNDGAQPLAGKPTR